MLQFMGVTNSWTQLSDWTTNTFFLPFFNAKLSEYIQAPWEQLCVLHP